MMKRILSPKLLDDITLPLDIVDDDVEDDEDSRCARFALDDFDSENEEEDLEGDPLDIPIRRNPTSFR